MDTKDDKLIINKKNQDLGASQASIVASFIDLAHITDNGSV